MNHQPFLLVSWDLSPSLNSLPSLTLKKFPLEREKIRFGADIGKPCIYTAGSAIQIGSLFTTLTQEKWPLLAKPFQFLPFLHNQLINSPLKYLHRNHNFFKIITMVIDSNLYMFGLPLNLGVKEAHSQENSYTLESEVSRDITCTTNVLSNQDVSPCRSWYFSNVIIKVDMTNNILYLWMIIRRLHSSYPYWFD